MALWTRRRGRAARTWVAPPESHTGLVVLTDGTDWRVAGLNAADGAVPAPPRPRAELTGAWLAEEFRASWRAAGQGRRGAAETPAWIGLWPGLARGAGGSASAWSAFFLAGGAMFRVRTRQRDAIEAQRWCLAWPAAGQDVVQVGLRAGDTLRVVPDRQWRQEIDTGGWPAAGYWELAASWMREYALVDFRYAVWWMAAEDGAPVSPMVAPDTMADTIMGWWGGHWPAGGSAVADRFQLPQPAGEPVRFAFLRWEPAGSPRPDGLADVLGLRRAGRERAEVVWWRVRPDGGFGSPRVSGGPAGGGGPAGLDLERIVALGVSAVTTGLVPTDVDWVEAA